MTYEYMTGMGAPQQTTEAWITDSRSDEEVLNAARYEINAHIGMINGQIERARSGAADAVQQLRDFVTHHDTQETMAAFQNPSSAARGFQLLHSQDPTAEQVSNDDRDRASDRRRTRSRATNAGSGRRRWRRIEQHGRAYRRRRRRRHRCRGTGLLPLEAWALRCVKSSTLVAA